MVQILVERRFAEVSGPIRWGTDDCCALVHGICKELHQIELMAPVGRYRSRLGAIRKLRQYAGGGVLEAAQKRAGELGLSRAYQPYTAAVGVVAGEEGPLLALFNGDRWIARTHNGVAALPAWSAVIAWELPQCQV